MNPVGLFLIALVILGGWFWYRRQPSEKRPMAAFKLCLIIIGLALLYLTVTGKLHWIGAFFAALLPLLPKLFAWLVRGIGLLRFLRKQRPAGGGRRTNPPSGKLTEAQAREILGVGPKASRQEIIDAHRRLMQKVHPDRGGNDWLASQLNSAKEMLLERVKE
ncbi:MAG TPA: DnaJ domain-containing protein [Marinobacterium sp.]|nr:DnaJ domain-containing protein [Marinobacterium sp.]